MIGRGERTRVEQNNFVLRGTLVYSASPQELNTIEGGYLVSVEGRIAGAYRELPAIYKTLPLTDFGDRLILTGFTDLHTHAPQFAFRGLGMDKELLEWLDSYAFPEETRYEDLEYARQGYGYFTEALRRSVTTRAVIFATIHTPATILLMDLLEKSGLITLVGRVNMDRNAPEGLLEESAEQSAEDTILWIGEARKRFTNTKPIITPRFIPSCTDELLMKLGNIRKVYNMPVQSHLSENYGEIELVRKLCPWAGSYGEAYDRFGLFGGDGQPTVMAHCVHSSKREIALMKRQGVFIAHCPQSNTNIASGIAPVRTYLDEGLRIGLGSDVAGGSSENMCRAVADAIQVSKLRWRLKDQSLRPLTLAEGFYLATEGGGAYFGKVGSFKEGYEMDAVIMDDANIQRPRGLSPGERLESLIYLGDYRNVVHKFVAGKPLF